MLQRVTKRDVQEQIQNRVLGKKEPNTNRKFKSKSNEPKKKMELTTTTLSKCIECLNLSIKDSFRYNRDTGLAVCNKRVDPVALNWNRPCKDFELATQATINKRQEWLKTNRNNT